MGSTEGASEQDLAKVERQKLEQQERVSEQVPARVEQSEQLVRREREWALQEPEPGHRFASRRRSRKAL